MKRRILLVLAVSLSVSGMAFCSDESQGFLKQIEALHSKLDLEGSKKSKSCKDFARTNIKFIESSVLNRMERSEKKLVKYNEQLKTSEDPEEINQLIEKISKQEKMIKKFQEVLLHIETLKTKVAE